MERWRWGCGGLNMHFCQSQRADVCVCPWKTSFVCEVKRKVWYWFSYWDSFLLMCYSNDSVITIRVSWPKNESSFSRTWAEEKVKVHSVVVCVWLLIHDQARLRFRLVIWQPHQDPVRGHFFQHINYCWNASVKCVHKQDCNLRQVAWHLRAS